MEASGSSLLYSREFYRTAKLRLKPDGILQQWLPDWDEETLGAVAESLCAEFPYVRAFRSLERWGIHFFASSTPLTMPSPEAFAARLPVLAARDFTGMESGRDAGADVHEHRLPGAPDRDHPETRIGAAPDRRPADQSNTYLIRRLLHGTDVFALRNVR